jgi:hypothetical protein
MIWLEGHQTRMDNGEGGTNDEAAREAHLFSLSLVYSVILITYLQVNTATKTNYGTTGRVHRGGQEAATKACHECTHG